MAEDCNSLTICCSSESSTRFAIALSVRAKEEDRRRSLLTGLKMYLSKPFELDELLIMVASLASIFH
ncbi:hypothetical protein I8752_19570 [Nostocaceae cyanobacterium CENA369]|uniref:Response regulatory domain-containing protein n=1 Tax=Dendronalium phyllosphericum CENA369 TaxID=1725256 RepID=A0A8J7I382_9NOST|nr:hypothetical protein [Dendronalium phyllosphericum]MBH8575174.1 hypothetical protein [Dendronalium phyllosphericum CENA369]